MTTTAQTGRDLLFALGEALTALEHEESLPFDTARAYYAEETDVACERLVELLRGGL